MAPRTLPGALIWVARGGPQEARARLRELDERAWINEAGGMRRVTVMREMDARFVGSPGGSLSFTLRCGGREVTRRVSFASQHHVLIDQFFRAFALITNIGRRSRLVQTDVFKTEQQPFRFFKMDSRHRFSVGRTQTLRNGGELFTWFRLASRGPLGRC